MKLLIASDHAGFELKQQLVLSFKETSQGLPIEWEDLGPYTADSVDYPLSAERLARRVLESSTPEALREPRGVLICGSGVGVSIAANRFRGIRAVLASSLELAQLSRQHNASNVICLGSRLSPWPLPKEILELWLSTPFEGGRHERRVDLLDQFQTSGS